MLASPAANRHLAPSAAPRARRQPAYSGSRRAQAPPHPPSQRHRSALAGARPARDAVLVQLIDATAEVGAVGDGRGVPALLVAADHAHDGAGPRPRVEAAHPRAAAGAAGVPAAVELQLGGTLPGRPVNAGDGGAVAAR